jgi:hypothetical protein
VCSSDLLHLAISLIQLVDHRLPCSRERHISVRVPTRQADELPQQAENWVSLDLSISISPRRPRPVVHPPAPLTSPVGRAHPRSEMLFHSQKK